MHCPCQIRILYGWRTTNATNMKINIHSRCSEASTKLNRTCLYAMRNAVQFRSIAYMMLLLLCNICEAMCCSNVWRRGRQGQFRFIAVDAINGIKLGVKLSGLLYILFGTYSVSIYKRKSRNKIKEIYPIKSSRIYAA